LIFTLKSAHNFPAKRFALRTAWRTSSPRRAGEGHAFGEGGSGASTSGTGPNGKKCFTGSEYFTVREIEDFEIRDERSLPSQSCAAVISQNPAREKSQKRVNLSRGNLDRAE
jgi:hypothetical protein